MLSGGTAVRSSELMVDISLDRMLRQQRLERFPVEPPGFDQLPSTFAAPAPAGLKRQRGQVLGTDHAHWNAEGYPFEAAQA
jgi:hypothetical protein